jgi:hypothetical protein
MASKNGADEVCAVFDEMKPLAKQMNALSLHILDGDDDPW